MARYGKNGEWSYPLSRPYSNLCVGTIVVFFNSPFRHFYGMIEESGKIFRYMIPVGFEVLTAVVMKSSKYITPCSPLKDNRCF
jgi:hypothetical protein